MKVFGYSKALYSSWFYLEPLRLVFDAGEGINCYLEGRLLAFRDLAITHAHTDHFTGLQNILTTRLREMEVTGEELPPLYVYYPSDSYTLERYFTYLREVIDKSDRLFIPVPLNPGDKIQLQGGRALYLQALKAKHKIYNQTALAYRVERKRWKLKEEFAQLPQAEINKLIREKGKEFATEETYQPLIYYSGDGRPLYDRGNDEISLMFQEATFLEPHEKLDHSHLKESVELFIKQRARYLVLFHLSSRYTFKEYLTALEYLVEEPELRKKIWLVKPGKLFVEDLPVPGF